MKKLFLTSLIIMVVFALASLVQASMLIPASDQAKENAQAPETSVKITEGVDGKWWLNRADFIHYAKPDKPGKPDKPPRDEEDKGPTCYSTFAKWPTLPINYVINPTNPQELDESFVIDTISTSAETWDDATSADLFAYDGKTSLNWGIRDYNNVIDFGDYPTKGVIGVASIWYDNITGEIYEFDIRFDTDYVWGNCLGPEQECINDKVMDLQNIATHELGHAVGMDDIYKRPCREVTMYGYSGYGDTSKRILEQADITGLQGMYGE